MVYNPKSGQWSYRPSLILIPLGAWLLVLLPREHGFCSHYCFPVLGSMVFTLQGAWVLLPATPHSWRAWFLLPGDYISCSLLLPILGEHGFCSLGSVAPAPHSCEWGCFSPLLGCMVFVTWFQLLREHSFSTFLHAFVDFYIIYNSCSLPLSFVVSP